jgi:hypothetical protein
MKPNKLLFVAFAVVAMAQLVVPGWMISSMADIAKTGNVFNFKVSQNRTGASLQGSYIWLTFEARKFKVDKKDWDKSQNVFVTFANDSLGFARVKSVTKEKPTGTNDWVKAMAYLNLKDSSFIWLTYPFSNYYVPNANTREAEKIFNKMLDDTMKTITLKINIRENQFLAGDLMVDSVKVSEVLKGIKRD